MSDNVPPWTIEIRRLREEIERLEDCIAKVRKQAENSIDVVVPVIKRVGGEYNDGYARGMGDQLDQTLTILDRYASASPAKDSRDDVA